MSIYPVVCAKCKAGGFTPPVLHVVSVKIQEPSRSPLVVQMSHCSVQLHLHSVLIWWDQKSFRFFQLSLHKTQSVLCYGQVYREDLLYEQNLQHCPSASSNSWACWHWMTGMSSIWYNVNKEGSLCDHCVIIISLVLFELCLVCQVFIS